MTPRRSKAIRDAGEPQPPYGAAVTRFEADEPQPFMEAHGNPRIRAEDDIGLRLTRAGVGTGLQLAGAAGAGAAVCELAGWHWPVVLLVVSLLVVVVGVLVEVGR